MQEDYRVEQRCPQGSFAYTIRPGDTLYLLAQRYNTTVEAIQRLNPGINPNNLQIGQVICIPGAEPTNCPNGFYYTIRAGDTLYLLAQRYGVSVDAIIRANPGIDPNNLRIGQTIYIPRPVTPIPPCPNGFYYSVRQGDTLFLIAQRFNISLQALINANPGINPNNLQIGQIICVPTF